MEIKAVELSKKFGNNYLFSKVSFSLTKNQSLAILGPNGSGKSTLLKCILGFNVPSNGTAQLILNSKVLELDVLAKNISIAAPYLELIEELTFPELIEFQQKFKPFRNNLSSKEILEITYLTKDKNKQIKSFSSGMKQRAKLGLAVFADTPFLFLDEPTSNLDARGIEWYNSLIQKNIENRIVITCSNHNQTETFFCTHKIDLTEKEPLIKALK